MDKKTVPARKARHFILLLCVLLLFFSSVSLYLDLRGIQEQYVNLAAEVGRSFYRAIDAIRTWNLDHDGIYVRVDENTQPNSFLKHPLKDMVTSEGLKLTMINHSQMTRLLSEVLTDQRGIHLHITGQHPMRPENRPDGWELHALNLLKRGQDEVFEVTGDNRAPVFRYIAPLSTKPLCLTCHVTEEAAKSQILGGVSVSFSYLPFKDVMSSAQKRMIIIHAMFLGIGLILIVIMGTKLLHSIGDLQASLLRIKRLEGFLPICAQCKKIRLEGADRLKQESWVAIEQYIEDRTDAEFTHGLCPKCAKELYPGLSLGKEA